MGAHLMRLSPLFEGQLVYQDKGHWVAPYHAGEYVGYAEATGLIQGDRINDRVRCINHPRQLATGDHDFFAPDYHGVIWTDDGTTAPEHGPATW
jgi:hypothetical protein